ncbi:MAG: D-alanyl-D-alanine carboxypeptidase/D-alanyl-D-alanine-endopeptidase [Fibrobacter sp.]|nr:D-alanyl-D-alanine carboxypeptidase/D-alanyl-D-alanine-endopeptidase [Fibrobacter sp.]MBQ5463936.1 D-alanyl-D-alanine carboxypeptidase/D-alanyl-D-alanine-endopeptidase [Fibrobacter sp.]
MNSLFRITSRLLPFLVAPLFAHVDVSSYKNYVDSLIPGVRFGMAIRSVKTGQEIGNVNGDEQFTPASTLKTLTTAAAIHFLPLDYEPKTELTVLGNVNVKKRTLTGTIKIRGEGDPNISARFYDDPFYMLYAMVDSIRAMNIDTIVGHIDLDSSYYTGPWKAENWRRNFYDAWYGAEIGPLGFNDNCVTIRFWPGYFRGDTAVVSIIPDVGYVKVVNNLKTVKGRKKKWVYGIDPDKSVITLGGTIGEDVDSASLVLPIRNPVGYFRAAFMQALKNRGVVFKENMMSNSKTELKKFSYSAAPLLSILDEINQRSQNFHAETLLRNLGAQVVGEGSVEGGRRAERKFLLDIGLNPTDFDVWDGSGLSPENKVKPSTVAHLLAKMARHPKSEYYINSFASPGVGSGAKRMQNLDATWLTRFKTGYIAEVYGLVGYIYTVDGDTLAVTMYLNGTNETPDIKSKDVLDTLWMRVINYTNNNYKSLLEMKELWLDARGVVGLNKRLDYFSKLLLGRPYKLGPMGEGHLDTKDDKPLVYLDSVDCVTYLENVVALAMAKSEKSLYRQLQRLRYKGGKVSYVTRKHYLLADWVGEGKYAKVIPMENEVTITRTMPKVEFFKTRNVKYSGKDTQLNIRYIPLNKAIEMAKNPYKGSMKVLGMGIVGTADNIDVTHTGFVIFTPGQKPILRHASSIKKQVVELPLAEYLGTRKVLGITLFKFIQH